MFFKSKLISLVLLSFFLVSCGHVNIKNYTSRTAINVFDAKVELLDLYVNDADELVLVGKITNLSDIQFCTTDEFFFGNIFVPNSDFDFTTNEPQSYPIGIDLKGRKAPKKLSIFAEKVLASNIVGPGTSFEININSGRAYYPSLDRNNIFVKYYTVDVPLDIRLEGYIFDCRDREVDTNDVVIGLQTVFSTKRRLSRNELGFIRLR